MKICRLLAVLCVLALALSGCASHNPDTPPALTDETAVFEGEGYRLTYPACFSPVGQTEKMLNFVVPGGEMAFTLTLEPNPHGEHPIEEYPDLMAIYSGVKILNEHSFAVEKYLPGVLSAYFLYTFSPDTVYLLEYNFGGSEEQRKMESLFSVEVLGE